ncbi:biotin--[acetyl-CoA-carboxylase] ligase [Bordetella genomosp. 13]|uniref:biotin--[biotin carboxyl-carrier protein] ligase n=1 Tax=Bordetella genomosp. 13 TaxID=463040 RepID=A0A1W6ZHZ4_9BORD|nr:biotin--[acetyl-CoA-carboxylase] ligase [Bordetella genomosp. 13]ARP96971.1 biotin--[acetyl-CoA-carboxylase] ligase [Bordetella genomosp. 13]
MPDLAFSADLPAPEILASALSDRLAAFRRIDWTAVTGSTNADLLARARAAAPGQKPWLLGAHQQESGRGRAGRPWKNRAGATLMFSCAFDVHLPVASLAALSPLAGMAACEGLRVLAGPGASRLGVKWPNDVQWREAKLAGVLVESVRNAGRPETGHTVVVGVGVNLRDAAELSLALQRPVADWTQVAAQSGAPGAEPADLVCAIASALHAAIGQAQELIADGFAARYARVDALAGRAVNVLDQGSVVHSGVAQGIDEQGRLRVATSSGTLPITVGEISIRQQA